MLTLVRKLELTLRSSCFIVATPYHEVVAAQHTATPRRNWTEARMIWRWTAWRLAISAFVVFHLTATVIWICRTLRSRRLCPPCGLHAAAGPLAVVVDVRPGSAARDGRAGFGGDRRPGDASRLRVSPRGRSSLVAEDASVSPSQVHLQPDVRRIPAPARVHGPSRRAAARPEASVFPFM